MNIVTDRFKTFLKQKTARLSIFLYSIVLRISYVFPCFCDLCYLLFFFIWNCLSIDNQYILQ